MCAHIAPKIQDNTNAIAKPFGPNHNPPVANNFMSPIPIGVSAFGVLRCRIKSNTKPTPAPNAYPSAAPNADARGPQTQKGVKLTTSNPIKNNGTRYASGIMRRRKSATEIAIAHPVAAANNSAKNK